MHHRRLGRTELLVSEIGFGALEIGRHWPNWRRAFDDFQKPSDSEAIRLVHQAIDLGIDLFDTAPAYVDSERLLGAALRGKRKDLVVATKCGEWFDGTASRYDYSYEEVFRFVESSLRNLQTEFVDILQIHSGSEEVIRRGETMAAMKVVQQQGKARFLGVSVDSEAAALAAIEVGDYDCIQVSYNLLNRMMESTVLQLAKQKDIGIIVKDGLNTGRLSGKSSDVPDESLRSRIERFQSRALEAQLSLPEYALRFVLSHDAVSSVIVGTKRGDHVIANVAASRNVELTKSIGLRERTEVTGN